MTTLLERTLVPDDTFRGYYTRAEGDGVLTFVASTAGVKRDGYDLLLDGLAVENFMRNPVFLWVHDYWGRNMPIGRVVDIQKTDSEMVAKVRFDLDDPFAKEVWRKYRDGFLSAVSIGWDNRRVEGNRIIESDLLDISAVPVPGDPEALMERAEAWARTFKDSPTTPPVGVDEGGSDDTRAVAVEQLDKAIEALTGLRDTLTADETPAETPAPPVETPADPEDGLLADLHATLTGDNDE